MSRETRSWKTHALILSQVELHPVVDAPLGKITLDGNKKKYFEIISVQKISK
jgi:hypothetical protein